MAITNKDLGIATAYGEYLAKGGTKTEEEFAQMFVDFESVATEAEQSATAAAQSATAASGSATAAASSASLAAQSATEARADAQTAANAAAGVRADANRASEAAAESEEIRDLVNSKVSTATQAASTASAAAGNAANSASEAQTAAQTATQKASEIVASAEAASQAKDDAVSAKTAAQTAAQQAGSSETAASSSAQAAAGSASTAQTAAQTATAKAGDAEGSASSASGSASTASTKATEATTAATLAQSYAKGDTSSRSGEATDNAKYYKEQAEAAKTAAETAAASITVDATLSQSGKAADAKATGDEISELKNDLSETISSVASAVEKSASGSIVQFSDGMEDGLMDSVKVNFSPIQNLNGYDYPWIGGAGKNLFHVNKNIGTLTTLGITYTINAEDNSITCNGTADGNAVCNVMQFTAKAGVTYTLSGTPNSVTNNDIFVRFHGPAENSYTFNLLADVKSGRKVTFSFEEDTTGYVDIRIGSGQTVNNLVFKPQIEVGSSATAFEPYENLCSITGRTGVNVDQSGKNLLVNNKVGTTVTYNGITWTYNNDGTVTAVGTATSDSFQYFTNLSYLPKSNLIFSGCPTGGAASEYEIAIWNSLNQSWQISTSNSGRVRDFGNGVQFNPSTCVNPSDQAPVNLETSKIALAVRSGKTVNLTFKPMIRLASDTDSTYASPASESYPVTWETEAGEVFGGHVDLVKGKLIVNYVKHVLDGTEQNWTGIATTDNIYVFSRNRNDIWSEKPVGMASEDAPINVYCDKLKPFWRLTSADHPANSIAIYTAGTNYIRIALEFEDKSSITANYIQTWLAENPVTVVYEIATPIEYDLDPVTIKSLKGVNTIWSDGDTVDVEYRADTKLYIDSKIAEAVANALNA